MGKNQVGNDNQPSNVIRIRNKLFVDGFHLYLHASIRAKLTANYVRKVFKYNGKEAPELPINFETIASVAMGRALKSA